MNSALTPEKRPDKNGKLVTRHVKTGPSAGLSGRAIPAPQSAGPSREKLTKDIAGILNTDPGRRGDMMRESAVRALDKIKDVKVIHEAHDALNDPERARYISKLIDDALSLDSDSTEGKLKVYCASDDLFRKMEDYGFQMHSGMYSDFSNLYSTVFNRDFKGKVTDEHVAYFKVELFAKKMQMSINSYSLPNEYYRELESVKQNFDRIEENIPVLMMAFNNRYDAMYYGEMADICDKVEESGYAAEDIGDLMRDRQIYDVDRALLMMNSSTKPLYSGVL